MERRATLIGSGRTGPIRRFVVALALAFALGFGLAVGLALAAAAPATARAASDDDAPALLLGLNARGDDPSAMAAAADAARRTGLRAIRVRVDWSVIEAKRGAPDWSALDVAAAAARRDGVRWLAVIDASPAWSRHDPPVSPAWWTCAEQDAPQSPAAAPPTDPNDLARFVATFARRYRSDLVGIEVWREPNAMPHWRRGGPDPEDYAVLLAAAADAAHGAAPNVPVVSAGLVPTTDVGVCFLSDYVFLDRLARTGALDHVDGIGVVISGFGQRADRPDVGREVLDARRAELLARVLARHRVARPIWIVGAERGASSTTATDAGADRPKADSVVDDEAAWFADLWTTTRSDWPWLAALFVGGQDDVGSSSAGEPAASTAAPMAVLDATGARTPLGDALARVAADAADADGADGADGRSVPTSAATWSGVAAATGVLGLDEAFGARIVHPWPVWSKRQAGVLAAAIALALLGTWLAMRLAARPSAASGARWIAQRARPIAARPAWWGRATLLAVLAADSVVPWPLNAPLVPLLVAAAAFWPLAAIWAMAAAAPFYFAAYKLGLGPALGPRVIGPVELLVLVAVAGAAVRGWIEHAAKERVDGGPPRVGAQRRAPRALDLGVLALVLWAALSPWWAEEPGLAAREWRTVVLEPALFYALLRLARDRRAGARAAWRGALAGLALAATWGLAAWSLGAIGGSAMVGPVWERVGGAVRAEGVVRASGPYNSPNNLALVLGRVVIGLASGLVYARTRRETSAARAGDAAGTRRPLDVAILAVCVAGLVATFSRGTILVGLPVSAVWLILVAGRGRMTRRAVGTALAVVVVVAALLAPFASTERVQGALALRPGTTLYYRTRLWQSAWRMGSEHPVLGVGLDNFMGLYRDRYVQRDVVQERFLSHPHNIGLDWWTRLGLPGLILLVLWVVGLTRAAAKALRSDGADRGLAIAAVGTLVYGMAHGLLDNNFFLVDLALFTWMAQAMILAALDPRQEDPP